MDEITVNDETIRLCGYKETVCTFKDGIADIDIDLSMFDVDIKTDGNKMSIVIKSRKEEK